MKNDDNSPWQDNQFLQQVIKSSGKLWIDIKLNQEVMDFLWSVVSEENKGNLSYTLAGNISKSEVIIDKDNWFYETVLKNLTERMFYRDLNNYHKYHIAKEESPPKFELKPLWVNYQKQHEFNPIHSHSGLYSFVVFMKIPTHWKEQHALPISANSNSPNASDFMFLWSEKNNNFVVNCNFPLSPEDEGRILFFPATLQHMVYPFYECEEERITISGNIVLYNPNRPNEYKEKEHTLKIMQNNVRKVKEELKQMRKNEKK